MQKSFKRFTTTIVFCLVSGTSLLAIKDFSQIQLTEKSSNAEILAYYAEIKKTIDATPGITIMTLNYMIEAANSNIKKANDKIEEFRRGVEESNNFKNQSVAQANSLIEQGCDKDMIETTIQMAIEQVNGVIEKLNIGIDNCNLAIEKENELIAKYNKMKTNKK